MLLRGTAFIIDNAIDALMLEQAITQLLLDRRAQGNRNPPRRLLEMQHELRLLASAGGATAAATAPRPATQLVATTTTPRGGASATMTVMEASELLGLTQQAVTKACREDRLPSVKVRGRWHVERRPVESRRAEQEQRKSA
jgi:excisionase family DNA binding protein